MSFIINYLHPGAVLANYKFNMNWLFRLFLYLMVFPLSTAALNAQSAVQTDPDFLFGQPRGFIGVRAGLFVPTTGGDLYQFATEMLTISKSELKAPAFALDIGWNIKPQIDVVFGFGVSKSTASSEYIDFVDLDNLPIEQETNLTVVPFNSSLKLYLVPRGRKVSRYAFVPNKISPYVGGGGGLIWYRFEQVGDFVDFDNFDIFSSLFLSDGWGLQAHAFAGVDIRIARKVWIGIEGRYLWAGAGVGGDFEGFDSIDLGGLKLTGIINYIF